LRSDRGILRDMPRGLPSEKTQETTRRGKSHSSSTRALLPQNEKSRRKKTFGEEPGGKSTTKRHFNQTGAYVGTKKYRGRTGVPHGRVQKKRKRDPEKAIKEKKKKQKRKKTIDCHFARGYR